MELDTFKWICNNVRINIACIGTKKRLQIPFYNDKTTTFEMIILTFM